MKRNLGALAGRYAAALRTHLKRAPRASVEPARALGRQAVALGLETLDVARIHQRAVAAITASGGKQPLPERTDFFFTEAITPIEETHRAALWAGARLKRLNRTLSRRTLDLSASHRSLGRRIIQRQTAEAALKRSEAHYQKLLKGTIALEKHLRRMAHRVLLAQEDRQNRVSRGLRDGIGQALLGINVRLLTMRKAAGCNLRNLHDELDSTRRLVDTSVKSIQQFAREHGKHHEP